VGIFVTKKLLIGRHFLAAKANWDLADLPIGDSFVGSLLVRLLVRSLVHSLVRSLVRSLVCSSLVRSTVGPAALRDTAWL
jgi:hypothetical protein